MFVINRRLALAADAYSHIALPGVAVAILAGIDPTLGALAALTIGSFVIHAIQQKTNLYTDTLIGVIFSLSLAIGLLILPESQLESALLGDLTTITRADFLLGIGLTVVLLLLIIKMFRRFTFITFSEQLAQVSGVKTGAVNLLFLLGLAAAVSLGIKVTGTLLVGSLLIIPASAAQMIARNFKSLFSLATLYGVLSVVAGIALSALLHFPPGPMIILSEGLFFCVSFLAKK